MIAAVVDRQHARRTLRVTYRLIEVDHRVEAVALAYPGIHLLPHCLPSRVPRTGQKRFVFERRNRPAEELDAPRASAQRKLLQSSDQGWCIRLLLWLGPAIAQIVSAQQHDH